MRENKYDDPVFFKKYRQMARSRQGLAGAGEWPTLQPLLPDFAGTRVLDLGCGMGWHAIYAAEHGARQVVATDISRKMLEQAKRINPHPRVEYRCEAFEDGVFAPHSFEVVLASLMLHYLPDYGGFLDRVACWLVPGGTLVYTVEHPVFTAQGPQDWYRDQEGRALHFPVDRYFWEGSREAVFLGERMVKYHRTLTTYLEGLLRRGFTLRHVVEPQPTPEMVAQIPGMEDELRRPMMLTVVAQAPER